MSARETALLAAAQVESDADAALVTAERFLEWLQQSGARMGRRDRAADSTQSRFAPVKPPADPAEIWTLDEGNAAAVEGRTLFPTTVVAPKESPALLVGGHNNAKLGRHVRKGLWMGMPIYHLTLEERATCPRSCSNWLSCYGNAMHMARRHGTEGLMPALAIELQEKAALHPGGFVVRLHTLGDFFSPEYVAFWGRMLESVPQIRAFGYTAWPRDSEIGRAVKALTDKMWDRFAIRFSDQEPKPQGAATMWPDRSWAIVENEALICPAQEGKTDNCGTCGLCWSPAAREKTILFIPHGPKKRKSARAESAQPSGPRKPGDDLNKTQDVVWRAIAKTISETGRSPIGREIAKKTGASVPSVHLATTRLETLGYLHKTGTRRALLLHVDRWPEGVAPRETKGRTDAEPPTQPDPSAENPQPTATAQAAPVQAEPDLAPVARPVPSPEPGYDETRVRRFESAPMYELIKRALEAEGCEVRFNFGRQVFTIDGRETSFEDARKRADAYRVEKGLTPLSAPEAAE